MINYNFIEPEFRDQNDHKGKYLARSTFMSFIESECFPLKHYHKIINKQLILSFG